jgi:hypothetical protein
MNSHKETYALRQAYHNDFTICNENIYFLFVARKHPSLEPVDEEFVKELVVDIQKRGWLEAKAELNKCLCRNPLFTKY